MEPVYCQNGHPNRPGTRICYVCRELIPPSTTTTTTSAAGARPAPPQISRPPQPAAESPAIDSVSPAGKTTSSKPSRAWMWLLALLLLGPLAVAAVWATFFPVTRTVTVGEEPTVVVEPAPVVDAAPSSTPPPADTAVPTGTASPAPTGTATLETSSPTLVSTITPISTIVGVVITPTFAFGRDANFIQNGDFSGDWANGWTRETRGSGGLIDLEPSAEDPDVPVLRLSKTGPGMGRLAQRVVLTFPAEGLVFRGRIQLAGSVDGTSEGRSALILRYEDANGEPLGASVWLDGTTESTDLWGTDPLPPLGPAVSTRFIGDDWQSLELWLDQEFDEALDDVDPVAVRQITIILVALGSEECAAAGCETILQASELSLTAEAP